jgi:hypothetical protein
MSKSVYIIRPDNDAAYTAKHHIANLNPEIEWEVTIKKYKKNKTAQQRNYYHKLLQIISEHTGDERDDLKTRICYSLGYVREVTLKSGEVVLQRLSTERLKVKEYSTMIESAQMMCMFLELRYPKPDEDRGYSA